MKNLPGFKNHAGLMLSSDYYFGSSVITGSISSSIDIPPCWKVFL
jgi:hypothetical protein